jgi:hypothetical protein
MATQRPFVRIVQQARKVLSQKIQIVRSLSDVEYVTPERSVFDATIGMHIRHSTQHFDALVNTVAANSSSSSSSCSSFVCDYDSRERNNSIETNREAAIAHLHALLSRLPLPGKDKDRSDTNANGVAWAGGDSGSDAPVMVRFMASSESDSAYELPSTLYRELSFCAHHATHHLAVIQVMLQLQGKGKTKDGEVGKAPSTLAAAACAAAQWEPKTNAKDKDGMKARP